MWPTTTAMKTMTTMQKATIIKANASPKILRSGRRFATGS